MDNNGNGSKGGEVELQLKKQILIDKVKQHTETLRESVIEHVENQLASMVDNCRSDFDRLEITAAIQERANGEKKRRPPGVLKDKEFVARNSLLSDLLEINHFRTIHQIFVAILIVLFMSNLVNDYNETGKINLSFELIIWSFGKMGVVFGLWSAMMFSTMVIFYNGFVVWAHNRKGNSIKLWDHFWLYSYITYLGIFFYYPTRSIVNHQLPPASAMIILSEQIRLIMKSHAFLRTNAEKVIDQSANKENGYEVPDFSKLLYFLFAPTLIYRDSYPRNSRIRWSFVVSNICQVIGCIFYVYFLLTHVDMEKFGREPTNPRKYILAVFTSMLPSAVIFVCSFFGLLHSWFNAFAEMLRFADRQFYTDWWNAASYSTYYRTWNIVVHDWLFTYVYKDMYQLMSCSNRVIPTLVVFTVSAFVHEYIVSFSLGFFFPIMYLLFGGFGVSFMFLPKGGKHKSSNIFFWLSLIAGNGIMVSLYRLEWYARLNCPQYSDTLSDLFVPRILSC